MGGGLVLGVGIRLGEAIAARAPVSGGMEPAPKLAERLGELENRLRSLEAESPQAISHSEGDNQEAGVAEAGLLGELRDWLEESVTVRLAEVETRLRTESERGQRQILDAFAESLQMRVINRISRLEEDVAGAESACNERAAGMLIADGAECSQAARRARQTYCAEPGEAVNPAPVTETPAAEARGKPSRGKIFG